MQIRQLGLVEYEPVCEEMSQLTDSRGPDSEDQLWFLQHHPVFTQGQAGKVEHLLFTGDIPVIQTDRGGQVTYHGPGQLVVYPLIDIGRLGWGPRQLVTALEQALIDTLAEWDIEAAARADAPGVYTNNRKIASLGLRIRKGCSFHGLALNIDMDLEPFHRINPCGYAGMEMTQMREESPRPVDFAEVSERLEHHLMARLVIPAAPETSE